MSEVAPSENAVQKVTREQLDVHLQPTQRDMQTSEHISGIIGQLGQRNLSQC